MPKPDYLKYFKNSIWSV